MTHDDDVWQALQGRKKTGSQIEKVKRLRVGVGVRVRVRVWL